METMGDASGDHQVIAGLERKLPEAGFEPPAPLVDEYDLVCLAVFVKIIAHGLRRRGQGQLQVLVYQHRLPALQVIRFRRNIEAAQAQVAQVLPACDRRFNRKRFSRFLDQGGGMAMINQGIGSGKSPGGHQLFGVQGSVRLTEYGMPFTGYDPELVVNTHSARVRCLGAMQRTRPGWRTSRGGIGYHEEVVCSRLPPGQYNMGNERTAEQGHSWSNRSFRVY